jgi:hypothetical protein
VKPVRLSSNTWVRRSDTAARGKEILRVGDAHPGPAGFGIKQPIVRSVADPPGQRGKPLSVRREALRGYKGWCWRDRTRPTATDQGRPGDRRIGPGAFHTDNPWGEFVIGPDLGAADDAGRPQIARARKIETAGRDAVLADGINQHPPANVAADIDPGPVIDRGRRRERVVGADGNAHIGGVGRHSRDRNSDAFEGS